MRRWLARARWSVRLRVTVLAAGVLVITLGVAAFVLLRALEDDLLADVRREDAATLRAEATRIGAQGVPSDAVRLTTRGGQTFELPVAGAQRVVMFVRDDATGAGGLVPASSYDVTFVGSVPLAQASVLGIDDDPAAYEVSTVDAGSFTLATASPLDPVRDTIATTKRLLWSVGPVLVALVTGLAWLIAGRALRPVHAVTSQVAAIGSRSLHERVPVPASGDEIAELAVTMNGMLDRLEAASEGNRRLVSDASHELRTPVAVMRAELEVASRSPDVDWDETTHALMAELDRLQGLVDDLLLLARGDERALSTASFSIADVARDVGGRTRRVPIEVSIGDDVDPVVGDRAAIARAVDHLVANAARHAATAVCVAVATVADHVVVVVDDDGSGIPAARRADVVQRFVRLDEARVRDGGGAGLGLAVASDVATAHGGSLAIGDAPLGGARLTLLLPRPGERTRRS